MPDIASGAFPVAFGDWLTAYRIYDKPTGFSVLRDPFSVATKGSVRFHARRRVGGQVVLGGDQNAEDVGFVTGSCRSLRACEQ